MHQLRVCLTAAGRTQEKMLKAVKAGDKAYR
jgi:hypothetical protein